MVYYGTGGRMGTQGGLFLVRRHILSPKENGAAGKYNP